LQDIPGDIKDEPFENFEQARNAALQYAQRTINNGPVYPSVSSLPLDYEYILFVDADMEMIVDDDTVFDHLIAPAYRMLQRGNDLSYWNTRLLRKDQMARYIGVTHEYLDTGTEPTKLDGAWFRDYADGSNRHNKADRDIKLLEEDVRKNPKNARSWFYLAQSYKDAGKLERAAAAYNTRINLEGWEEEVWYSKLARARCRRDAGYETEFLRGALDAFGDRPARAEPLYDLANYYRNKGKNELATMFAERGLHVAKPSDLLFVEDVPYDYGLLEELSIAGYYVPKAREGAHDACEKLALSRDVPAHVRDTAWSNLFFYTRPLHETCPSFAVRKIDFVPPDGYHPMNPSVCRAGESMWLNVRCVNYVIGQDGRYSMPHDGPGIKTRNFLFTLDDDLRIDQGKEILPPADFPTEWSEVIGFEDMRLFHYNNFEDIRLSGHDGHLWCSATVRQHSKEGWCEIALARISDITFRLHSWHTMRPEGEKRNEKNWMPVSDGTGRFIYSCDPLRVVDVTGKTVSETTPPVAADHWGGSSQAVVFDGGYLALVHERIAKPGLGQRQYQRRFVWFDGELELRKISRRFYFGDGEGEFVCGMCEHPDGERLVVSYGVLDREAWLATVDVEEVRLSLRDVVPPAPPQDMTSPTPKDISDWLWRNTNAALQSINDVDHATAWLRSQGCSTHPDRWKDWDTVVAMQHTLMTVPKDGAILDAGADRVSQYLPSLAKLGYTSLTGINKICDRAEGINGVWYERGDIENTHFHDECFAFIACLSVVEHGVDIGAFLKEAARLLRKGGHLFISTDYWYRPLQWDRVPAMTIFTEEDMRVSVDIARTVGLRPTGAIPIQYTCKDKVVRWAGMDYTFINLLFEKVDNYPVEEV